jgi:hypothetical protein
MATLTRTPFSPAGWRSGLRIVAAITAKDILDGIKNRTTASILLLGLFFVVVWRALPLLAARGVPVVLVYDAGRSSLLAALQSSSAVDTHVYDSEARLRRRLAEGEVPELGLIIPADFDQTLAAGAVPELRGLVLHWVSPADAARLQQAVTAVASELAGGPVRIHLDGGVIYPPPGAHGLGLTANWSVQLLLIILGLSFLPNLMFEERRARTLDALLISPASPAQVTLAKALAGLFYTALGLLLAVALYHRLIAQWWLAGLAAASGAVFSVALGLLLGLAFTSRQQLMIAAQPLIVFLFGPLLLADLADGTLLPRWIGALANWTPTVGLGTMLQLSFSNQSPLALWAPALVAVMAWAALLLALVTWQLSRADR